MGNSQHGSLYGVESRRDLFSVRYASLSSSMTSTLEFVNWILKFADDTNIFSKISNVTSSNTLQNDFSNPGYKYLMDKQNLQEVSDEKDLVIMITSDLKSAAQVVEASKKANRALGMISRTIKYKSKSVLLSRCGLHIMSKIRTC